MRLPPRASLFVGFSLVVVYFLFIYFLIYFLICLFFIFLFFKFFWGVIRPLFFVSQHASQNGTREKHKTDAKYDIVKESQ